MEEEFLMGDRVFSHHPIVFVVKENYQIIFITAEKGIAWVEINGKTYKDAINGVVRSESETHRIEVPQKVLDEAREYIIGYAHIAEREPYSPKEGEHITKKYTFRPYNSNGEANIYMLADTHSQSEAPARAASFFGDKLDLLILNGDIGDSAKNIKNVMNIYRISDIICKGEIPVIYTRGNHETRGLLAEDLHNYVGTEHGNTFFSFRLGNVWGIVLDCGEDKIDSHPEYGEIAYYRPFREAQTEYLQNIINNKNNEYEAEGVEYKIAICHLPFTQLVHDFADDIYNQRTTLLNEIGINVMLSGHKHRILFDKGGVPAENKIAPNFPIVVGAKMNDYPFDGGLKNKYEFCATALTLSNGQINVKFTNSKKEVVAEHNIE